MKIALDAMGGDYAPSATVKGAVLAVNEYGMDAILVGDEDKIIKELAQESFPSHKIKIIHSPQVVGMSEPPSQALRQKKSSSIKMAVDLVRSGEADALVSAGNSGVTMATSQLVLGKLKGVDRVAIAAPMPTLKGTSVLIDAGANVDCKAPHLFQFAIMGQSYTRALFELPEPKIGLLGIGEEDDKGNTLTKESFKLLKNLGDRFIGNIEGKEVFMGAADIVVCDGFVGNVVLKVSEGLAEAMAAMIKKEISERFLSILGYYFMKPALKSYRKKTDYSEYGGAPLLGLNKISIISHGRSSPKAIKNALRIASELYEKKLPEKMGNELSNIMQ
jgi:glycerol-3-phosphate acyltransferase PlsX